MSKSKKQNPLLEILVTVVLPSLILMKLSSAEYLGALKAFLLALAIPFSYGIYEMLKHKKVNYLALLGLINVLLTGGIGLLELNNKWLAIKEAAIPLIIGVAVLISSFTKKPLINAMLYNKNIVNVDLIQEHLNINNKKTEFDAYLRRTTFYLSLTFLFSSAMNYALAKIIVTSPAGTEEFNNELGRMNLLSYPMIAIPSTIMMMLILYYLWKKIHQWTNLALEEIVIDELKGD